MATCRLGIGKGRWWGHVAGLVMASSCCFSRGGEYFASGGFDGELKVWNTKSGTLHHTFVSTHLNGIHCLSWSREKLTNKKRRSRHIQSLRIASVVGSKVIVWTLATDEENVLQSEHSDELTCLDWDCGVSKIYAGGEGGHVMEWDVAGAESVRRWKADKSCVQCVCCYGDGTQLLTAGRTIKLWSLEDYSLLKKFSGHSTAVKWLCFTGKESFLSGADHERVLNYWQTDSSTPSASAVLTCEEDITAFDCVVEDGTAKVATVCETGLFLYQFSLSPLPSKPVTCCSVVQYVTSPPKPATPSQLPVLAVIIPPHSPDLVTLAHTSSLKPSLESIEFDQPEKLNYLVRDVQPDGLLLPSTQSSVAAPPPVPAQVTVLGPGNMTVSTSAVTSSTDPRTLSDRLEPRDKPSKSSTPSADALTQLLVQAIASGDNKILEEVLRVSKERLVSSTVKGLPVNVVMPFMMKLIEILQSSPARGLQLSLWIKMVLSSHAAYLLTVPQLASSLSSLHQLLESRVNTFSKLCHLQGKLDLLLAQGQATESGVHAAELALTTPLITITLRENSASGTSADSGSEEEVSSKSEDECTEEPILMETDIT